MQHLDFRCRILNYKTHEVNIVKLLERIYDPSWDKNIDTEKSSGLIGGYQIRYDENLNKMCGEEINTFMNEVVFNTVQEYCMQEFIYKGGNETYEMMIESWCPKKFKCVYNPWQKEPNIDDVINSLNSAVKNK